jgi:hypothetical protein
LIYSEDQPANRDFAKIYALKNLEGATITVVNKSSGKEKRFQAD